MSVGQKIKNFFKKMFKVTNWKRWLLLSFTIIGAIIGIVLGSIYHLRKNVNESIQYGGGVRYQVEAKNVGPKNDGELVKGNELKDIAESLNYRFSSLNDFSASFRPKGDGIVEITRSNVLTGAQTKNFENAIVKKPTLVFTDVEMKPIFTDGLYIENSTIDYNNINRYAVPLKENGATVKQSWNGAYYIEGEFENKSAAIEWSKATKAISQQHKIIFMWINLDELVDYAKVQFPTEWKEAHENPANFSFVSNTPFNPTTQKMNAVKKYSFDAAKYLISIVRVDSAAQNNLFYIQGNAKGEYLTKSEAQAISSNINFSSKNGLKLSIIGTPSVVTPQNTEYNFKLVWIAGLVIVSLIAIMLMVNYGLLGALSTIAMALYIFLTLVMFTVLRGEYSPASFAALFGALLLGAMNPIVTLNKFKQDIYKGEKPKKALRNAQSKTFINLLDVNVMVLITAIIFFFMGTQDMKNFSIVFAFSSLFSIAVMLLINRLWITLVVHTETFDNKLSWFSVHSKKIGVFNTDAKYRKFDYVHLAKLLMFIPIIFFVASIIVYGSVAGVKHDGWAGFNKYDIFSDPSNLNIRIEVVELLKALSIVLVAILIYTLVRYKWTFMVSFVVSMIINIGLTFSVVVITRIPFDHITILIFMMSVIFSEIQTMVLFGSIKAKMHAEERESAFTKEQIRTISNSVFFEEFADYMTLMLVQIGVFALLIAFYRSTNVWLNLLVILAAIYGTYNVLFITISLWSKCEERRQHNIQKRIDTKYWVIPGIHEEQVFPGINSFTA